MGCTGDGLVCPPQVRVDYRARSNPTTDHVNERSRVTPLYDFSKDPTLKGSLYATNHPCSLHMVPPMVFAFSELGFVDLDYYAFAADLAFILLYFIGH